LESRWETPEFKLRDLIKRENIRVLSSNYALYGDLSRRVGDTLSSMVPTVESYSIDESFLNLGEFNEREVETLARELRERVLRWVGIPTCVGIRSRYSSSGVASGLNRFGCGCSHRHALALAHATGGSKCNSRIPFPKGGQRPVCTSEALKIKVAIARARGRAY
jgi:hypothetical protein